MVTRPIDTLEFLSQRRSRQRFPLTLEVDDRQPLSGSIELMVSWPCNRGEEPGFEDAAHPTVIAHSCSALALIIDDDLGFVMWLGEIFTELGCQAVPALHCRQALAFIQRIDLPIAILVLNPELRGAKRTVKVLVAANPGLRLVLIQGSGLHANPSGIQARFTLERPSPGDPISRPEWAARIRRVLI